MSYLAQWVSEIQKGDRITAADVEVLARVQQALLASDKHHQQARDAQANVEEKLVVNAAVDLVERVNYDLENLRVAVANLLAVEAAS